MGSNSFTAFSYAGFLALPIST